MASTLLSYLSSPASPPPFIETGSCVAQAVLNLAMSILSNSTKAMAPAHCNTQCPLRLSAPWVMGWILLCGQIKSNDQRGTHVSDGFVYPKRPDYLLGFRGHQMEVGSMSAILFLCSPLNSDLIKCLCMACDSTSRRYF